MYNSYKHLDKINTIFPNLEIKTTQLSNNKEINLCLNNIHLNAISIHNPQYNIALEHDVYNKADNYFLILNLHDTSFLFDGKEVNQNDLVIVKPEEHFHLLHKDYFNALFIHMNNNIIQEEFSSLATGIYKFNDSTLLTQLRMLSFKLLNTKLDDLHIHEDLYIKTLIAFIYNTELFECKTNKYYAQFNAISSFIKEHHRYNLTIEEIAEAFDVTSRTLRNIFNEQLSMPPKKYLKMYQLNQLKDNLSSTEKISETIIENGLEYHSLVSQEFKKLFGCTPKEYKNSI